jgi:hypothetical protein
VFIVWAFIGYLSQQVCGLPSFVQIPAQFLICSISAYGFFHLFVSRTVKVLEKNTVMKRKIFGTSYLEGTWIGYHFIESENKTVIFVLKIEQSINHMRISAEDYYTDMKPRCKLQSIGTVSVDDGRSSLLFLYDVFYNHPQPCGTYKRVDSVYLNFNKNSFRNIIGILIG